MNWYLEALKKYAVFSGRARRTEYWMFVLFNFIFSIATICIDFVVGAASGLPGIGFLFLLYGLGTFIPSLAVAVRRLHDTGRSGWWMLIGLVPLIGAIVLIVFNVQAGQPGANKYGPDPKAVPAAAAA
jgi:uncharacterized membrane protein YhaH (DUF805 family)